MAHSSADLFSLHVDVALNTDMAALLAFQLAARPCQSQWRCSACPLDPEIRLPSMASDQGKSGTVAEDADSAAAATGPRPLPFLSSLFSSPSFQGIFEAPKNFEAERM
jgi:hypothetical protein